MNPLKKNVYDGVATRRWWMTHLAFGSRSSC